MRRILSILFVAISIFSVWLVTTSQPATDGGIDLAFVIDGSASIEPNDWEIQIRGIQTALQDELLFPTDGSMAVSIVQFTTDPQSPNVSRNLSRVEIPYTKITSPSIIQDLVRKVGNIRQIAGNTNPGDGINKAMEELSEKGNLRNRQIICLSTDGPHNFGTPQDSAIEAAKSSAIGLDQFSVIAIKQPPGQFQTFLEKDALREFGDLVFGGGAVTFVNSYVEFANVLAASCLNPELELIAIEVNQAIQDWQNSVPLIRDKTTYVRVHVRTKAQTPRRATVRLHGTRDGNPLEGSPLTPINPEGSIEAQPQLTYERGNLNHSLNFSLPRSWLNGTIELKIEGLGGELNCKEPATSSTNDPPNDCKVTVSFTETQELEVKFVGVEWESQDGITYEPTQADMEELAERLRSIFPVANVHRTTGEIRWPRTRIVPPDFRELNIELENMRFWDFCWEVLDCNRLYYGILNGPLDVAGRANDIPGTVASGTMEDDQWGIGRNVHAHELGHLLGRHHAVHSSLGLVHDDWTSKDYKQGWCGEYADVWAPDFPYSADIRGATYATLGPMGSVDDAMIFGLDSRLVKSHPEHAVMDPNQIFELMSYCVFRSVTWHWISKFTYEGLYEALHNENANASMFSLASSAVQDYLVVRGLINLNTDTAEFKPFGIISSSVQPPLPPQGDYVLQLVDSSNNILFEVSFKPSEMHADPPVTDAIATFLIPVPKQTGVQRATILHNGKQIGSRSASTNPPTVKVVFPNGGESIPGPTMKIQWASSDPDGDPMSYIVQYSHDNGATWETLIVDLDDNQYEVDTEFLTGSTNGLVRVMASDGFHAVFDQSDATFTVPNNPPQAFILSPVQHQQFVGLQSIFFEADAWDREEGRLTGNSIQWTSNLDGLLGTGEFLTKNASELAEGQHTITLVATDSAGAKTTAEVTINVLRVSAPPISRAIWSMFGHDPQHTGRSSHAGPKAPNESWVFQGTRGLGIYSSPAIGSDGTIYVASLEHLHALTPEGQEKWKFRIGFWVRSSPAIGPDGTVYIASGDGNVYAINPDGTEKWTFETPSRSPIYSSPTIGSEGTIYISGHDSVLYAIDPSSGLLKWAYVTGSPIISSPVLGRDNTIYIGSADWYLYAIDTANGRLKWKVKLDGAIFSSPAISDDGIIYIGTLESHTLYAFNGDGTLRWSFKTESNITTSPAIAVDGTFYISSGDGTLHAVNPQNGETIWSFTASEGAVFTSPIVDRNGTIYVGSTDGHVYAINPQGQEQWRFEIGRQILSSPVVGGDGILYVGSLEDLLHKLSDR